MIPTELTSSPRAPSAAPADGGGGTTAPGLTPMAAADAASFQRARPRLFGIACRVLGSPSDADDVVQDAWIRWHRTDRTEVRDAAAFLATTTTRLAINVSQTAHARRETSSTPRLVEPIDPAPDPSARAERAEALELALLTVLERLSPTERAVYLLREAFDLPYREIADTLELSEVNARQIFARARRRLRGDRRRLHDAAEPQRLLAAFAAAARGDGLETLQHVLAADVAAGSTVDLLAA